MAQLAGPTVNGQLMEAQAIPMLAALFSQDWLVAAFPNLDLELVLPSATETVGSTRILLAVLVLASLISLADLITYIPVFLFEKFTSANDVILRCVWLLLTVLLNALFTWFFRQPPIHE